MKSKVLLIEDGVTIHRVIDLYIDFDKFDLVKVFTREDADIKLKSDKFDYILLDHKLENIILNSYVSELKTLQPNASIILLVGAFDRFNADTLALSGADDYITKPFDAQSLNSKLSSDEGVMKASLVEEIAAKDQLRDSSDNPPTAPLPQNISQNNIAPDSASQAASLASAVPGADNKAAYLSSLEDSVVDDPTEDGYIDEPADMEPSVAPSHLETTTLNLEAMPAAPEAPQTQSSQKLDPSLLSSPLNLLMHDAEDDMTDPVIDDPIISEENIGKETELFLDQKIENANEVLSEISPVIQEVDTIEEPTLATIETEAAESAEVDLSVSQVDLSPSVEVDLLDTFSKEEELISLPIEDKPLEEEPTLDLTLNDSLSPSENVIEVAQAEVPANESVLMHADELPELDMSSLEDASVANDDEEFTLTITSHDDPLNEASLEEPLIEAPASLLEPTLEPSTDILPNEESVSLDGSDLQDIAPIQQVEDTPSEEVVDIELSLDTPIEEAPSNESSSEHVLMHADELPELDMSSLVDASVANDDEEEFTLTITSHGDSSAVDELSSEQAPIDEPNLSNEGLAPEISDNIDSTLLSTMPIVEEEPAPMPAVSILGSTEPTIDMLNKSLGISEEASSEAIEEPVAEPLLEPTASIEERLSVEPATELVAEPILEEPKIEEASISPVEDIPAVIKEEVVENKPLVDDDDWLSDAPGANDVVDILGTIPDKTLEVESELEHSVPTPSEVFNEEEKLAIEPALDLEARKPIAASDTAIDEPIEFNVEANVEEEVAPSLNMQIAEDMQVDSIVAEQDEPLQVAMKEDVEPAIDLATEPISESSTEPKAEELELAEDEEIVEEVVEEEVELAEDEEIVEEIVEEEVDEIEEEIEEEFAHDNVFQTDLMMDESDPLAHIADTPMDDYSNEMEEAEEFLHEKEEEEARQQIVPVPPMQQSNQLSPINTQFSGGGITISISREEILSMLGSAIDKQLLENAIKEVVAKNMQEIVRNVVPTVAEQYIKEEIERLKNDGK